MPGFRCSFPICWIDFDPTNDQIPGEQHITTAVGRDFQDVTPLRGIFYGGGSHELRVAVDVNRVPPEGSEASDVEEPPTASPQPPASAPSSQSQSG